MFIDTGESSHLTKALHDDFAGSQFGSYPTYPCAPVVFLLRFTNCRVGCCCCLLWCLSVFFVRGCHGSVFVVRLGQSMGDLPFFLVDFCCDLCGLRTRALNSSETQPEINYYYYLLSKHNLIASIVTLQTSKLRTNEENALSTSTDVD